MKKFESKTENYKMLLSMITEIKEFSDMKEAALQLAKPNWIAISAAVSDDKILISLGRIG